jgi:hypothetical protein
MSKRQTRSTFDYESRRNTLYAALNELEADGTLQSALGVSVARIQALVVELDHNGEPLLPAPWIKWISSEAKDVAEYNNTRLDLTGDQLLNPAEFGVQLNSLHPAYIAVVNDYLRRGLRLNKSVRIYARPSSIMSGSDADESCQWHDLVEHLVGAINALPAAQRAVAIQRLHIG